MLNSFEATVAVRTSALPDSRRLNAQPSRSLRLAASTALVGGALVTALSVNPTVALADCTVAGSVLTCTTMTTTDTAGAPPSATARSYTNGGAIPVTVDIPAGNTITGFGLAITNTPATAIGVTVNGAVQVDAGKTPTVGGTAALSLNAAGPLTVTGAGTITNLGVGEGLGIVLTGAGSANVTLPGAINATGTGVTISGTATTGDIVGQFGPVTAGGSFGIEARSATAAGNIDITANGAVKATAGAGIVGELTAAGSTGNITITTNAGATVDGKAGVGALSSSTGTAKITIGDTVTATAGNGAA
ncbi:MAG: autotransporter outer membrane beta-barrel domain-containing protein, partial [Beijerinckiaceae bacterium]